MSFVSEPRAAWPRPAAEATEIHTRLLKIALATEESRGYWEHAVSSTDRTDPARRALAAFEQRWFGNKSLGRVQFLLASFADRYDAFPQAVPVLSSWRTMDAPTRQAICHWHVQLSDPLYRLFTGRFLVERRAQGDPRFDRAIVLRWLRSEIPDRWSESTRLQFASKLLSAASEAGLISPRRDPRTPLFPRVPDLALAYLLHLLRGIEVSGSLLENPYLASVGLVDGFLDQRLRALPGINFRRMANLTEFEWEAPDLASWAAATLSPRS